MKEGSIFLGNYNILISIDKLIEAFNQSYFETLCKVVILLLILYQDMNFSTCSLSQHITTMFCCCIENKCDDKQMKSWCELD